MRKSVHIPDLFCETRKITFEFINANTASALRPTVLCKAHLTTGASTITAAICNPKDKFSQEIGERLALNRALTALGIFRRELRVKVFAEYEMPVILKPEDLVPTETLEKLAPVSSPKTLEGLDRPLNLEDIELTLSDGTVRRGWYGVDNVYWRIYRDLNGENGYDHMIEKFPDLRVVAWKPWAWKSCKTNPPTADGGLYPLRDVHILLPDGRVITGYYQQAAHEWAIYHREEVLRGLPFDAEHSVWQDFNPPSEC